MRFEDAFAYTRNVAGSFEEPCCRHLWEAAIRCHGTMLEVGVLYGRSASLLLQAARVNHTKVILIDPCEPRHQEVRERAARDFPDVEAQVLTVESKDAQVNEPLGLVHIDAVHCVDETGYDHPWHDAEHWLPLLEPGGFACFHDYDPVVFPDIVRAVDHFTADWIDVGTVGTLAIRVKPV